MILALVSLLSLGERYLTREEALKLVFPDAEAVVEREVELDPADRARVAERYGSSVEPRQRVFVGLRGGRVSGYALILTEITKTLPATFIVGVSPEGEVTEVAVMEHLEHIGTECSKRRFLEQFVGRTNRDRIRVGSGILPYSGATLSCNAVARGVRKAVAVVQYHFLDRPENVRALVREEPVRRKRYLMGTFCEITAYGDEAAVERAFDEIKRLEKVLSNYDERSELSRLNREGRRRAGPDLLAFVRTSLEFSEKTGGAFDVTVEPLVELWGFKGGKHRVPSDAEIAAARARVGWKRVCVEGDEVRLEEGTRLDPGAIGKGIAVDRAADALRRAGVRRALVDFGSSLAALGRWEVALKDPLRPERALGTVTLSDESVSSSGGYEKFFTAGGRTYGHILDPRTGRPAEGVAGTSVVAPTATESDAWSTAAFVLGTPPDRPDVLVVTDKGELRMNEGMRRRLKTTRE
jgi:thiamine biosynthesis lipoprotein ApbE/Na+-translocating ferredoxin:NAD+ oxidoreductase RnfG subunit